MDHPTITSKNLPNPPAAGVTPPAAVPVEQNQVPYSQIVAKPLREPNFMNLVSKNKNVSIRWVNRSVGEKESQLRFNQCQSMGFECVKPEEVTDARGGPCPSALIRDGRVIYGDLILMKMSRADYIGALKYNEQRALDRVRKPGVAMSGGREAHQDKNSEGRDIPAPVGFPKKVQPYVPPLAEVGGEGNLATK